MKKWGLACAGVVSRTCLAALPLLRTELGPVSSTSFRLAARIANSIRAGFAVRSMHGLAESQLILVCTPGGTRERVTAPLRQAGLKWEGKILITFDSGDYSSDLEEFRQRGAFAGSVNPVDGYAGRYVIEGHPEALREAKLMVRSLSGKPLEVNSESVRMYDAGRTLASSLFTPLIESCVECMRQAGMEGPDATSLAEALLQRSLRSFMHSGRKSWSGPVARADRQSLDREHAAISLTKPLIAEYFRHASDFALDLYQTFPELTRYNPARWTAKNSNV